MIIKMLLKKLISIRSSWPTVYFKERNDFRHFIYISDGLFNSLIFFCSISMVGWEFLTHHRWWVPRKTLLHQPSAHAQPLRRFRKNIFPRILRQFGSDLKLRFGSDLKQCALSGNNVCFRFLSDISFLIWHVVSETVCRETEMSVYGNLLLTLFFLYLFYLFLSIFYIYLCLFYIYNIVIWGRQLLLSRYLSYFV